ncbi:MAG TPA: class I SAM-dependent methyltransferase [Gaiellaceae bacterium]|nr:class I SAM-dependent methyltransferase [Gaiellaceae bacterium]
MRLADLERPLGRRFARLATTAVVARPRAWRGFRWLMRWQFDRLAPTWSELRRPEAFAALEEALAAIDTPPQRILDLGTGTGSAAFKAAQRFPEAEVVGVDVAERMLAEARLQTPAELEQRVRFEVADGAALPFGDREFDLVVLANAIPFFAELARVLSSGGRVLFSFSAGPETPIWVPPERLRRELRARGFSDFADFEAGGGTALLARKTDSA